MVLYGPIPIDQSESRDCVWAHSNWPIREQGLCMGLFQLTNQRTGLFSWPIREHGWSADQSESRLGLIDQSEFFIWISPCCAIQEVIAQKKVLTDQSENRDCLIDQLIETMGLNFTMLCNKICYIMKVTLLVWSVSQSDFRSVSLTVDLWIYLPTHLSDYLFRGSKHICACLICQ